MQATSTHPRLNVGRFQGDKVFSRNNGVIQSALALVSYLPAAEQTERLDGLTSFHFLDSRNNAALGLHSPDTGTQVSLFETDTALIVAPRGTPLGLSEHPDANLQWADLANDLNLKPTSNYAGSGRVHSGFKKAADGIWEQTRPYLQQAIAAHKAVHFAGHSLGAAIATHLADRMNLELGQLCGSVLTEGAPAVGWSGESQHLNDTGQAQRTVRLVKNIDPVPGFVPFGSRVGTTVYLDSEGLAQTGDQGHFWDRVKGLKNAVLDFNFNPLQAHLPQGYTECVADSRNREVLDALASKLNR